MFILLIKHPCIVENVCLTLCYIKFSNMKDYVDLYADCNECDTVEGVKNYSNRIFNDILTKINRTSKTIEDDPIYTTKDVANILCVSVRTIDEYCSNGEIEYKKAKKRRYFSRKNIDDFTNKGKRRI